MKCSKPLGLQQLRGCIKGNSKLISALLPPQQPLPAPVLVPLGISLYFFHFLEGNLDGDWEWKHLKTSLSSACLVFSAPTTFFLQALGPPNLLTMNGTSAWSWVTSGSPMQEFPGIQLSIINTHPQPPPFLLVASASSNLKKWQLLLCQRANPPISIFSNHTNSWVRLQVLPKTEHWSIQIANPITLSYRCCSCCYLLFDLLDILIGEILKASNGLKQKSRKNPHFGLFKSDMFLTSFWH